MKLSGSDCQAGYGFGTFQGVFTPIILTIIGVVMYLRFEWMLGNIGLTGSLALVAIGSAITLLSGLSISALATNMRMKGGGAYFMFSRSLGLESDAALGIPQSLSQAISVSFYIAGFAEALTLIGPRPPRTDETKQSYGTHLERPFAGLAKVPAPVFVLSTDNNLSGIFA